MNNVLLIPAYNPEPKIISVLTSIDKDAFLKVLVVDDGSAERCADTFKQLADIEKVEILRHEENMGKGAALKTGFSHILEKVSECTGVVTADADGQHSGKDISAVARALAPLEKKLVIGSRSFDRDVPLRSALGNKITRLIMKLFFKINLTDTQSGLRAIPVSLLPEMLEIQFNRYEFEMEMLLIARKNKFVFEEVAIETIYENENAASSFSPVIDSARIYFVLFRYVLASLATAAVDYTVFFGMYSLLPKIFLCTYTARLVALFVNFALLKRFVFQSREKTVTTGIKYIALVIASGFISSQLTLYFNTKMDFNIVLSKIIAESLFYVVIFITQKEFVFKR